MKKRAVFFSFFATGCSFFPSSGTYLVTTTSPSNTCGEGFALPMLVDEAVAVSLSKDLKHLIIDHYWYCDLDVLYAQCSLLLNEELGESYTLNTTVSWSLEWDKANQAAGLYGIDIACTGDSCDTIAQERGLSYPCSSKVNTDLLLDD